MSTLREAAQQALWALEMLAQPTKTNSETPRYKAHKAAITALRAALKQQEQEPVAWMRPDNRVAEESTARTQFSRGAVKPPIGTWVPLYTTPPRRESQALTKEDVAQNLRSRYDAAKLLEERRQEIAQPRREWQGLTDDEISALFPLPLRSDYKPYSFARAIEAALKEKNQ
jgi:hypothetical protein